MKGFKAFVSCGAVVLLILWAGASFGLEGLNVPLHPPHVGANSETFHAESDAGGITAPVVWHFVLNGLDRGTPPATIYVTFQNSGAKIATGRVVGNGSTQHFYIGTSNHDTIVSGYALVMSQEAGNLVLSHVVVNIMPPPPPPPPPPGDEETETPPPPPPGDEETETPPPGDEETETPPPVIEETETPPPAEVTTKTPAPQEEGRVLPYTGMTLIGLIIAAIAGLVGLKIRQLTV